MKINRNLLSAIAVCIGIGIYFSVDKTTDYIYFENNKLKSIEDVKNSSLQSKDKAIFYMALTENSKIFDGKNVSEIIFQEKKRASKEEIDKADEKFEYDKLMARIKEDSQLRVEKKINMEEFEDFSKALSDYSKYSAYKTLKNYSFMYSEDKEPYMYFTDGVGVDKHAYILNQYDIQDLKKGIISENELKQSAVPCINYKFKNVIHSIYKDGDKYFIMVCDMEKKRISVYCDDERINTFKFINVEER